MKSRTSLSTTINEAHLTFHNTDKKRIETPYDGHNEFRLGPPVFIDGMVLANSATSLSLFRESNPLTTKMSSIIPDYEDPFFWIRVISAENSPSWYAIFRCHMEGWLGPLLKGMVSIQCEDWFAGNIPEAPDYDLEEWQCLEE